MKLKFFLSSTIFCGLLFSFHAFAATNNFFSKNIITVTNVIFNSTSTSLLIMPNSGSESWSLDGGYFRVTNPDDANPFMVGSADANVPAIRVLNANGTVIACMKNTIPGNSYITLPTNNGTYLIDPVNINLDKATVYNSVCGAASCLPNYVVSGSGADAVCVQQGSGSGTTFSVAPIISPAKFLNNNLPTTEVGSNMLPTIGNLPNILNALNLSRNVNEETLIKPLILNDAKEFKLTTTSSQLDSTGIFISYGMSEATVRLGEGERRAVIRDYFDTVKTANIDWQDIERMVNGQKPITRNLESEKQQVAKSLKLFNKITGRNPNFKNSADDLAWNTLMYRIRFQRDMIKERQAIVKFKSLIKANPKTPQDWAAVRAIAYSGIKAK